MKIPSGALRIYLCPRLFGLRRWRPLRIVRDEIKSSGMEWGAGGEARSMTLSFITIVVKEGELLTNYKQTGYGVVVHKFTIPLINPERSPKHKHKGIRTYTLLHETRKTNSLPIFRPATSNAAWIRHNGNCISATPFLKTWDKIVTWATTVLANPTTPYILHRTTLLSPPRPAPAPEDSEDGGLAAKRYLRHQLIFDRF